MNLQYETFWQVPNGLSEYLSVNNLSQDYWSHTRTVGEQSWLEKQAQKVLNIQKYNLNLENFLLETKLDDMAIEHPFVPRLHSHQALFLVWSVDLEKDTSWLPYSLAAVAYQGLEHKREKQVAKTSCANCVEFCTVQMHIDTDYILIGTLKTANWWHQARAGDLRQYYKKFWRLLSHSIYDKKIIALPGSYLQQCHLQINQSKIPRESYHREIMMAAGFHKTKLDQHFNHSIRIDRNTEVWIREH